MELKRFYFTFGTDERYPYRGGWVEVWGVDLNHAVQLFKEKYPNRSGYVWLNCADYYNESDFTMKETGNLGAYCHDVIVPKGAEHYDK